MSKKYNLGSKSDMKRFERDLEKSLMNQARSSIMQGTHEVTCPCCGNRFGARIRSNVCPHCRKTIDLQLDM